MKCRTVGEMLRKARCWAAPTLISSPVNLSAPYPRQFFLCFFTYNIFIFPVSGNPSCDIHPPPVFSAHFFNTPNPSPFWTQQLLNPLILLFLGGSYPLCLTSCLSGLYSGILHRHLSLAHTRLRFSHFAIVTWSVISPLCMLSFCS